MYREQLEVELQLPHGALAEGGTHRYQWLHGLLAGRAFRLNPRTLGTPLSTSTPLAAAASARVAPGPTTTYQLAPYSSLLISTRILDWHPPLPVGARTSPRQGALF
jgi:hypothetical protein